MEYQCEKETTGIYRKISLKNLLDRDDIKNLSVDDLQNVIDTCTALMAFNGPVPEGGRITIWDYYETLAEEFLKDDENDQWAWESDRVGTVRAAELFVDIMQVLRSSNRDMGAVASAAFVAGMLAEQMTVRLSESYALAGRKQKERMTTAQQKAHPSGEADKRYEEMYRHYCRLRSDGMKTDAATRNTAQYYEVSMRTIQRARKKFEN